MKFRDPKFAYGPMRAAALRAGIARPYEFYCSPVREALKQLAAAGYVELVPNRGAFAVVSRGRPESDG